MFYLSLFNVRNLDLSWAHVKKINIEARFRCQKNYHTETVLK